MKKLMLILLLLPTLGMAQYKSVEDSLDHMRRIKNNYEMIQNDVGCMYANGTMALGGIGMYLAYSTNSRNTDSPQDKLAIIGGGVLIAGISYAIAVVNRRKHAAKYRLYRKYYKK